MENPYESFVLTDQEMVEITDYVRPSFQIRILREWGIPFVVGRDGHPKVLREHLKAISGARATARREAEPRLEGLGRG